MSVKAGTLVKEEESDNNSELEGTGKNEYGVDNFTYMTTESWQEQPHSVHQCSPELMQFS